MVNRDSNYSRPFIYSIGEIVPCKGVDPKGHRHILSKEKQSEALKTI